MSKKMKQPCKPWERWGTPDDIRNLRGYSRDTAKSVEAPKPKKPKLVLVRGGKR